MTLEQLRERYPNATIVQVTPAEFERLKQQYADKAVLLKDLPGGMQMDSSMYVVKDCIKAQKPVEPASPPPVVIQPAPPPPVVIEPAPQETPVTTHIVVGASGNIDSDDAIVVFVVIGLFVVAALFIGVGFIAYDMIVNRQKYSPWYDLALAESPVVSSSSDQVHDWANLLGIRFSTGFNRPNFGVGLMFDAGYLHVGLNENDPASQGLPRNGSYVMLGPQIRFGLGNGMDEQFFYGELLAGRTTLNNVDVVSAARIGFRASLGRASFCDRCFWGMNLGSLYLNLKPQDGLLLKDGTRNHEYQLFLGGEFGFQF